MALFICFLKTTNESNKVDPSATIVDQTFIADFDGSLQKYVEITPDGFAADKPIFVLIALHGHGSDRWQFATEMRDECRATRDVVTANAMLMISPDYRAKTSWMGPAAEADLLQIIRIVKEQFQVQCVIVSGGSMGGTSALTFAALHPDQVDGVVALNGIDWATLNRPLFQVLITMGSLASSRCQTATSSSSPVEALRGATLQKWAAVASASILRRKPAEAVA